MLNINILLFYHGSSVLSHFLKSFFKLGVFQVVSQVGGETE